MLDKSSIHVFGRKNAAVQFDFEDADLHKLEQYEFEFYDDEFLESESSADQDAEMARILQQLTFPFCKRARLVSR